MTRSARIFCTCVAFLLLSTLSYGRISRFTPSHTEFFKQAVKEKGLVCAILATTDRVVRDTQIGLAGCHYFREDGLIHEDIFGPMEVSSSFSVFQLDGLVPRGEYRSLSEDEEFIRYLIGNNLSSDAVYYLFGVNIAPSDTLDYYKGLSLYTSGGLQQASGYFKNVPETSTFFEPSVFYAAVCDVYQNNYTEAKSILSTYKGERVELLNYELAAISLLEDDSEGYKYYSKAFTYSSYTMKDGEKVFDDIYKQRFVEKGKSPWVAAGLSAVVPGLGKFYVGNYGEGAASLLLGASFTAFAVESWVKVGAKDWRTILFTTLASLLHISNIYGSYISVGLYNDYLKNAQNQTIVFNIHVPVRSLFK